MSAAERFLVTGALGCIGAWTVRALVRDGMPVVAFDLGRDHRRLTQIMSEEELAGVDFVVGDITDLASLERTLDERGITNVIHLAALQVPFCRADPPLAGEIAGPVVVRDDDLMVFGVAAGRDKRAAISRSGQLGRLR